MKKERILSLMILFFIFTPILLSNNTVKGENLVDSTTIKNWSNSYISEYMKIIEEKFGQNYGYYFNFYGKHPFEIKSIISSKNGVAIEMIPNNNISEMLFKNNYTDDKIEISIFKNNMFENKILNATLFYRNNNIEDVRQPFLFSDHIHGFVIKNLNLITNESSFLYFNDSDLLLINSNIDGVFYYHTYLNSNKDITFWTNENANETALTHIKKGLSDAFLTALENNEFKNFFSEPELKSKIVNIKNKLDETRKNSSYNYSTYDWEIDLKELDYIAFKKYGITNDFFQYIIKFLNADYIFPSENTISENNNETNKYLPYIYNGVSIVILTILFIFVHRQKNKGFFSKVNKEIFELIIGGLLIGLWIYFISGSGEINLIQILILPILIIFILVITEKEPKFITKYKRRKRYKKYINEIKTNEYTNVSKEDSRYYQANKNTREIQRIKDKEILEKFMGWR